MLTPALFRAGCNWCFPVADWFGSLIQNGRGVRVSKAEHGHIGVTLTIWTVVTGGSITAMVALSWHWAVCAALLLFITMWLTAILALWGETSRAYLAGTLRKSAYTQIYTKLTRRNVMWVWGKLCDPADDRARFFSFLRTALTWRLYDGALLIAVAYPLILVTAQWIISGQEMWLGSFPVYPEADFWPARAGTLGAYVILICGMIARKLASASPQRFWQSVADWLLIIAGTLALAFAFAFAGALAGALAVAFALAGTLAFAFALAGTLALAFAVALAFAGALAGAFAGALALAVALAVALALAFEVAKLVEIGRPRLAYVLLTLCSGFAIVAIASLTDWSAIEAERASVFLFLAVFPLINALFDFLSYGVTLALLRFGLQARLPVLWGLVDLAVAAFLFLALGATLVAVVHGLNLLAGTSLLDLEALFLGVWVAPWDYVWLYLMLFSTILPTALHGLISLLGVQGIWPRPLRRRVAGWVASADRHPLVAFGAGLALATIWAVPLLCLGLAGWLFWRFSDQWVLGFLDWYFHRLLWVADVPVGAF